MIYQHLKTINIKIHVKKLHLMSLFLCLLQHQTEFKNTRLRVLLAQIHFHWNWEIIHDQPQLNWISLECKVSPNHRWEILKLLLLNTQDSWALLHSFQIEITKIKVSCINWKRKEWSTILLYHCTLVVKDVIRVWDAHILNSVVMTPKMLSQVMKWSCSKLSMS